VTQKPTRAPDAEDELSTPDRKERVIHTRVPAVLEQELKRLATSLRVPVSNVVRAILEDAVAAVDVVGRKAEGEMRGIAERLAHNRDRLRGMTGARSDNVAQGEPDVSTEPEGKQQPAEVLGYQSLLLASKAVCSTCGAELPAGSEAFLGIGREPTAPRVVIGRECLPAPAADNAKERES
jgi:hypothetical protein